MSFSVFCLLLVGGMFAVCLISIVIRMTTDTTTKPWKGTSEYREAIKKSAVYTKTLVVGQEVYMFCGSEFYGFEKGKVVKITSAGVEVLAGKSTIRFDNNGTELEVERRKRHGFEPEPGFSHDRFMQSVWYTAPECGPWQLDDMPFEERKAKIKHHQQLSKIMKTLAVGQEVWMTCGPYMKGECFMKGKVVQNTPTGVEVLELPWGDREGGELWCFCLDGTQAGVNHRPEFGHWRLDDMPFEERTLGLRGPTNKE